MLRTRLLLILLLISTGFFASIYKRQFSGQSYTQNNIAEKDILEAYFKNSSASKLNEQGQLNSTLDAREINKFINQPELHITEPDLDFYSEQGLWLLSAKKALLNIDINSISLEKDVLLTQDKNTSRNATELRTETLNIDLNNKTANSDAMINLQNGRSKTTAKGLEVDLQNKTILMPLRVQSEIMPQTHIKSSINKRN